MELRVQEDTCDSEIETVTSACEQLLMTAYREALLAHLQNLVDEVSQGLQKEVIDAARREADNPPSANPMGMSKAGGGSPQGMSAKSSGAMPKGGGGSWNT